MTIEHGTPKQRALTQVMTAYERRKYEELLAEWERLTKIRRAIAKELNAHVNRIRGRDVYYRNKPRRFVEAAE